MKWSLPLGRVLGIRIGVHATFVLILLWFGWAGYQYGGVTAGLWALALVLLLFTCVVLHELGHSVVALKFGIEVHSITLLPIGGVAAMKAIPEEPHKELLIAVAGPMVNVMIVSILAGVTGGWPAWDQMPMLPGTPRELLHHILLANIVLVVFNMIPAFPMDGGRVLRSLLAIVIPYGKATAWAAGIGQFLAVGFVGVGFWFRMPILMIIAVFVFLGAENENRMVRIKRRLRDVRVRDIMMTEFATVHPGETIRSCLDHYYRRKQEDFPVVADGRLIGLLPRRIWQETLHKTGEDVRVGDVMLTRFISLHPETELSSSFQDLWMMKQAAFPVLEHGELCGLIPPEDVARHVHMFRPGRPRPPRTGSDTRRSARITVDLG